MLRAIPQLPFTIIFAVFILASYAGCDKNKVKPSCTQPIDKPDLTNLFAIVGDAFIPVGSALGLKVTTKNEKGASCGGTESSGTTMTLFIVEYKPDNFSNFDTVFVRLDSSGVDVLRGDQTFEAEYDVTFSESGLYRVTAIADGLYRINERNEVNNDYSNSGMGTNKRDSETESAPIIQVSGDLEFDPRSSGFSPGEFVKITRVR